MTVIMPRKLEKTITQHVGRLVEGYEEHGPITGITRVNGVSWNVGLAGYPPGLALFMWESIRLVGEAR